LRLYPPWARSQQENGWRPGHRRRRRRRDGRAEEPLVVDDEDVAVDGNRGEIVLGEAVLVEVVLVGELPADLV
jgi:hypothetical protein